MIDLSLPPAGVELLRVRHLSLRETAPPVPTHDEEQEMNRIWEDVTQANPLLFDGPVVGCVGWEWEEPHDLTLTWARTTYRFHGLRQVPGAPSLPAVFASVVQPDEDGRILVGRMASSTASPGRWQLPGGAVEPPAEDEVLDVPVLHGHAARELAEETGLGTGPGELRLWRVTRRLNGDVGFLFAAPGLPAALVRERYAELAASETAAGRDPELAEIAFVGSLAELEALGGTYAEFVEPVVRHCAGTPPRLDA
ncbi:NUDIX domain-containing protein [Streptomyces tremellae]|uniref:Nudix hydrolase domain-containing protein n=1 Tax=Streptomyces tremellae TaxID=1124239 RepID=A0ABP7EXF7_9ACTN